MRTEQEIAAARAEYARADHMGDALFPPCPHRYYSPGDEAGFFCKLTLEPCTDNPPDCPAWSEVDFVCPACLEFKDRYPVRTFTESKLLAGRGGEYYCRECCERYASVSALALAAISALRDSLDDGNYSDGLVRGLEEALGAQRLTQ